jgi:tetratricopeptide (TPR) repeat protein
MLKTPYPIFAIFLALCFCLVSITTNAAILDTIVKRNMPPASRNMNNLSENFSGFSEAVAAFKQDSLDKGLHLFSKIFRQAEESRHIMTTADYNVLEIYSFVNDADDGKLSPAEKKILGTLFLEAISKSVSGFNGLQNEINKQPPSDFITHLKLFILYASGKKQAEKEAGKLLNDSPDDIAVNELQAELLYGDNKYDKSLAYCNKLITLSPQYAHAYELRGKDFAMLNKPDSAVADYDAAIKLFPDNKRIQYHRSLALMDLDK